MTQPRKTVDAAAMLALADRIEGVPMLENVELVVGGNADILRIEGHPGVYTNIKRSERDAYRQGIQDYGARIEGKLRALTRPTPSAPEPDTAIRVIASIAWQAGLANWSLERTIKHIEAIRAAPEPEGGEQPVAWRYRFVTSVQGDWSDWFIVDDMASVPHRDREELQPLYARPASPAPAATPEKRDV